MVDGAPARIREMKEATHDMGASNGWRSRAVMLSGYIQRKLWCQLICIRLFSMFDCIISAARSK